MYKEHPVCERPDNENVKIWRYVDFTKFISLLDKKTLFFVRGDTLSDSLEGSYPEANICSRPIVYKDILSNKFLDSLSASNKNSRKLIYLNSWHMNEYESAAMWRLYLKSDEGIAIKSSFKRLKDCFNNCEDYIVSIGCIKYIDYKEGIIPEGNFLHPFLHKRKSFEHENELRAIITHAAPELHVSKDKKDGRLDLTKEVCKKGLYVPVNIDVLIEKVFVSPKAEEWFYKLTKSIIKKYESSIIVEHSDLNKDPVY